MKFSAQLKARHKNIEWPNWWRLAFVAAIVGSTMWFSLTLTRESGDITSIWLSNAVLIGVLLRVRPEHWIAYLTTGFLVNCAIDGLSGEPILLALSIAGCNTIEIVLAAALLRFRLADASDLTQRRSLLYFLFWGVIVAPLISALLGATVIESFTGAHFLTVLRTWYLADAIGITLVIPLVLSVRWRELIRLFGEEMIAKTLGMLALTVVATLVIFAQSTYPLRIIMFPVLMLVIFELGVAGTAIAIVLLATIAIMFTIAGLGPTMAINGFTTAQRVFFVQTTLATVVLVALPMAVILTERERLRTDLEKANNVLRSLAMTDSLTGLANRRQFDEMLDSEWRRTARVSGTLSLLLLDIDHFKAYNDRYGHQSGDDCLKNVAKTLMKSVRRSGDMCARYGGEEFAVILPNVDTSHAIQIAELIRTAVEAIEIEHVEVTDERLTVSIGVASIEPRDSGARIDDLVKAADLALYKAKRGGRNRSVAA